jgi:hypothetical protein
LFELVLWAEIDELRVFIAPRSVPGRRVPRFAGFDDLFAAIRETQMQ